MGLGGEERAQRFAIFQECDFIIGWKGNGGRVWQGIGAVGASEHKTVFHASFLIILIRVLYKLLSLSLKTEM